LSSQVANLRVEILIPENGCYHADCNDHGHCKGGDRRDPPLQSSDDSKDAHDENNEHAKNNEADSPMGKRLGAALDELRAAVEAYAALAEEGDKTGTERQRRESSL